MAKCVAVASAGAGAGAGPLTKGGLIGALADWFEIAPLREHTAGSPIDWAPSPTFHKLQTKVNFFLIRLGRKKGGGNRLAFELGKVTCWIRGRHALPGCRSHALKLCLKGNKS